MSTNRTSRSVTARLLHTSSAVLVALGLTACSGTSTDEGAAAPAPAADFPTDDITFVVPYAAGGASDLTARTLAAEMEELLGVSIVVENRTGGAGSVGLQYLAGQDADGYTIGYLPVETTMLGQQGYPVDPGDYDYLGQAVSVPATIAVPADSPHQTLEDLVQAAEESPGSITVGNSGPGSIWEAATSALGEAAGVEFQPVPFEGGAPAVTAAVAGQIDAVAAAVSETAPAQADGRLRVLAVLDEEPSPALPEVETAADLGYDVVIGGWGVVGAPTGLPEDVAQTLADAVEQAVAADAYQEVIETAGNIPLYRSPAELEEFIASEAEVFESLFGDR